jgi:hypothetical protein
MPNPWQRDLNLFLQGLALIRGFVRLRPNSSDLSPPLFIPLDCLKPRLERCYVNRCVGREMTIPISTATSGFESLP